MSEAVITLGLADAPARRRMRDIRRAAPLLAVLAAATLSGCAQRHSITVGSIPDDYRTNHPIVVSEKEQVLDLPVAASDRGVTAMQRTAIEGFLAAYDTSAAPPLKIMIPAGSANEVAANHASSGFARIAQANGVPASRIMLFSYQAAPTEVAAPVRIAFAAVKAHTGQCGRWPEDIGETTENKHYANFGCAYQNNLAAQVANPSDLLGPRKMSPVDAEKRGIVIDEYRIPPEIGGSEVFY